MSADAILALLSLKRANVPLDENQPPTQHRPPPIPKATRPSVQSTQQFGDTRTTVGSKRPLQETQVPVSSLNGQPGPAPSTFQAGPTAPDDFPVTSYQVHVHSRLTWTEAKPAAKKSKAADGVQVKTENKSVECCLSPWREDVIKILAELHNLDVAAYDITDRGPPFQFCYNKGDMKLASTINKDSEWKYSFSELIRLKKTHAYFVADLDDWQARFRKEKLSVAQPTEQQVPPKGEQNPAPTKPTLPGFAPELQQRGKLGNDILEYHKCALHGRSCWVDEEGHHLGINIPRLNIWTAEAAAGNATIQTPPNHRAFDRPEKGSETAPKPSRAQRSQQTQAPNITVNVPPPPPPEVRMPAYNDLMSFVLANQLSGLARPPFPPPQFPPGPPRMEFEDYRNGAVPDYYRPTPRPSRCPPSPPPVPELVPNEPELEIDNLAIISWKRTPTESFRDQWAECLAGFELEQRQRGRFVQVDGLEVLSDHFPDLISIIKLSDMEFMELTGYSEADAFNFRFFLEGYALCQWELRQKAIFRKNQQRIEEHKKQYNLWLKELESFAAWQKEMEKRNRAWWTIQPSPYM